MNVELLEIVSLIDDAIFFIEEETFMKKNLLRSALSLSLCAAGLCGFSSCGGTAVKGLDDGVLTIGLECDYAPFNWTTSTESEHTLPISNSAGNYADGYDINFAKMLGQQLNVEVKIVKLEWGALIVNLNSNVIDCIIAGMTDTEERRESIDFTNEYYRSELVFITQKSVSDAYNNQVLSSDQIQTVFGGKNLVSQESTVTNEVLDIFATNYNSVHLTPVSTFARAANDVLTGAAFAMSAELPVAQAICSQNDGLGIVHINQEVLGSYLSELGVSVGVRKGDSELKDAINNVLASYDTAARVSDMASANERVSA